MEQVIRSGTAVSFLTERPNTEAPCDIFGSIVEVLEITEIAEWGTIDEPTLVGGRKDGGLSAK